jgi:exonuclease III
MTSETHHDTSLRIVAWNIQQGGDTRREPITAHLVEWRPDVCILLEYGNTDASRWVRNRLEDTGLSSRIETIDVRRYYEYGMLVAARWPLHVLGDQLEGARARRWRLVQADGPLPLVIGCAHVTNRSERPGNKYHFLQSLVELKRSWTHGAGLIVGDFNTGQQGIDEETPYFNDWEQAFMETMVADGWADGFRHLHGDERAYSWWRRIEGQMQGFRMDHAFVSPALLPHLQSCDLVYDENASDHAALVIDLAL